MAVTISGSMLERSVIEPLSLRGFQIIQAPDYKANPPAADEKFVVRNFPHPSLFGDSVGKGRRGAKEAMVQAPTRPGRFLVPDNGHTRTIIEVKFQDVPGSVDEKLPFVWHSFLESFIPNWVIVFGGDFWERSPRGLRALDWLKSLKVPDGKQFFVLNLREFFEFSDWEWGDFD